MAKDNLINLKKPESFIEDPITDILRQGARRLLSAALEAEVETFLKQYKDISDNMGWQRVVRNGYLPEREIQTGIGQVQVKAPRIRDRQPDPCSGRIRFTSAILPPYLRKTKSIETLLPWLYLKGVSTGDFTDALAALLGKDAPGLSAATISRLKTIWQDEYNQWQQRDLSNKRYVYFWVDGIYCNVRMDDRQCLLVIIGATEHGHKELVALEGGFRESEQSWIEVLVDIKRRGLQIPPQLAIGDGSLGFWKALSKVYDTTRWQRCWVHKTANVLNNLPKSLQAKAKERLHQIWMADNKAEAVKNFDAFIQTYEAKYPKATDCLKKDRDVLLTFYDFPAEHWRHIRTTNPIESTFATVRLRTAKVRSCFSSLTVLTMAFQLCRCAQKRWIKLHHPERLGEVIRGVKFINGIIEKRIAA
ncbi:MAG: IS256 family transposase [Desulfobacteraceae bacterium]|jgi:transposase-like protein|nr:MAG: IS256 family transposase [Desulfobacteraceae bacterium]